MELVIQILESSGLQQVLLQPNILILIGMAIALAVVGSASGKKSQRTNAFFADRTTKYNLAKAAISQLKKQKVDKVCLYCGSFKNWKTHPLILLFYIYILNRSPTLFVASANPGVLVLGAPGMGKTFYIIDSLLMSGIDQGFPIILYDYKGGSDGGDGGQTPHIAGYAAKHGYNIRIFAPGKKYTCTINPLDFLENHDDAAMAETIATTFQESLKRDTGKSDDFFGPASLRLLYSSFLLAKSTQYPDLAMAYAILDLPKLAQRLNYAKKQDCENMPFWNSIGFSQFMSVEETPETSSGILAGAQRIASTFIQSDIIPCILGETNISLKLKKKEMLIFQSNESRKKVFNPLIAGILEVTMNENFSYQRKIPLIFSEDEGPTIKMLESIEWPNRHRSKGLVMIFGAQNEAQVTKEYSKESLSSLKTGLKNKFIFNLEDEENEKKLSASLGEREIKLKNKSTSHSRGRGRQTTVSEQEHLTPLMRPDDLRGMPSGSVLYRSPELKKGNRGNIPWKIDKLTVSSQDLKMREQCSRLWFSKCLPRLETMEQQRNKDLDCEVELVKRLKLAERLFPLPPENSDPFSMV